MNDRNQRFKHLHREIERDCITAAIVLCSSILINWLLIPTTAAVGFALGSCFVALIIAGGVHRGSG